MTIDLDGKKGLVMGIANDQSIAYGCAKAFRAGGAELGITYLNEKARPHVEPLSEALGATIFEACDVTEAEQVDALFERIKAEWGRLDFLRTLSRSHRRRICTPAWSTAPRRVSCSRCTCRAIRSSVWRGAPSR